MITQEQTKKRTDAYTRYMEMYDGKHDIAFNEKIHNKEKENIIYIVQNFCSIISNISADYLVGAGVTVVSENEDEQEIINDVNKRIIADAKIYEAALTASIYGDVVFLVHENDKKEIEFSVIDPKKYFPLIDPSQPNTIQAVELRTTIENDDDTYLLVETYTIGKIGRTLYLLSSDGDKTQVSLSKMFPDLQEEQTTNLDFIPIVQVKNYSTAGRFFGISDYVQVDSLQHALNNRLSQIDTILDKHADPKMTVPKGVLDKDGNIKRGDIEMFEMAGGEGSQQEPKYITWDANIKAAFDEIELIIKQLARVSETPLNLLGMDDGGAIESGVAIKLKYAPLLKKTDRKRSYFKPGLEKLYTMILKASGIKEPSINVLFNDPLPENKLEELNIISTRLAEGTLSKVDAIMEYEDNTREDAEAILARVDEEQPRVVENTPPRIQLPQE